MTAPSSSSRAGGRTAAAQIVNKQQNHRTAVALRRPTPLTDCHRVTLHSPHSVSPPSSHLVHWLEGCLKSSDLGSLVYALPGTQCDAEMENFKQSLSQSTRSSHHPLFHCLLQTSTSLKTVEIIYKSFATKKFFIQAVPGFGHELFVSLWSRRTSLYIALRAT